jgi:ketosteroid isomerase-like protein
MKHLILIVLLIIFFACSPSRKPTVEELFAADRKFSAMSVEKGFPAAFTEFAHENGVILRENSRPIVGKTTIANLYAKADTAGVHFTWDPLAGDIANSGDLGYTYGTYTFKKDTVLEQGTYVSIWKKDNDGNWKYVLDTGNEGLGE